MDRICHKLCVAQTLDADQNNELEIADFDENYQEFKEPLVALAPNT